MFFPFSSQFSVSEFKKLRFLKALFLSLIFLPAFAFGQETKKITKISSDRKIREIYYVLESDGNTPHGEYKMFEMFGMQNELLAEGNYSKGVKVGTWTEYFRGGNKIKKSFGRYENGTRVGTWEFRNIKGETEQIIDFGTFEVIYFKWEGNEKDQQFKVFQGADTIRTKLERPPLFLGGTGVLAELIVRKMAYPKEAWHKGKGGLVYVVLTIDRMVQPKITESLSPSDTGWMKKQ